MVVSVWSGAEKSGAVSPACNVAILVSPRCCVRVRKPQLLTSFSGLIAACQASWPRPSTLPPAPHSNHRKDSAAIPVFPYSMRLPIISDRLLDGNPDTSFSHDCGNKFLFLRFSFDPLQDLDAHFFSTKNHLPQPGSALCRESVSPEDNHAQID